MKKQPIKPHRASMEGVEIRPYRMEDVEALFEAARESIREIHPWLPWCHPGYTLEESLGWVTSRPEAWATGQAYSFVMTDAETGRFLGGCGINQIDWTNRLGNLGYWVRRTSMRRGVATKATRLAARFALEELGLHRVEIFAALKNVGSLRVAEKAGAKREGTLRKRLWLHDRAHDVALFSLVREDLSQETPSS